MDTMTQKKLVNIVLPRLLSFVFLGFFIASIPALSGAVDFSYGANVRHNALLMRWPSDAGSFMFPKGSFGISATRARIWSRALYKRMTFQGALETSTGFTSSDTGLSGEGSLLGKSKPLERWDVTFDHIKERRSFLRTRLERFDMSFTAGGFDCDIGRQPVSFGTSHFISVLDILAPFAPGDLDGTYKPGIDAFRIRRGLGASGEAEVIAAGAQNINDSAVLGRLRSSIHDFDFELLGGHFRRRNMCGVGWEGEVKSTGFWGEAAFFQRRDGTEKNRGGWSQAAFSGIVGVDCNRYRKFKAGGSLMVQDFGVRKPGELADVYNDAPFREGWVFLGSHRYGILTASYEMHPLIQSGLAGILNLVDNSTLWQPRITVNTGNNTDICMYGWVGTGEKARVTGNLITIRSEFGMLPRGAGFYARWFF